MPFFAILGANVLTLLVTNDQQASATFTAVSRIVYPLINQPAVANSSPIPPLSIDVCCLVWQNVDAVAAFSKISEPIDSLALLLQSDSLSYR